MKQASALYVFVVTVYRGVCADSRGVCVNEIEKEWVCAFIEN